MIDLKTGYLIGLSTELGSMIANIDNEETILLKNFGKKIGRAFQIQDDILEIFSDTKTMGKSLKSDFLLNKKTYISIKAQEINSKYIQEVIKIAQDDYIKGIDLYKSFLNSNSIILETELYIKNTLNEANTLLNKMAINKKNLYQYTDMILNRKS